MKKSVFVSVFIFIVFALFSQQTLLNDLKDFYSIYLKAMDQLVLNIKKANSEDELVKAFSNFELKAVELDKKAAEIEKRYNKESIQTMAELYVNDKEFSELFTKVGLTSQNYTNAIMEKINMLTSEKIQEAMEKASESMSKF